jgi:hypothetical protein
MSGTCCTGYYLCVLRRARPRLAPFFVLVRPFAGLAIRFLGPYRTDPLTDATPKPFRVLGLLQYHPSTYTAARKYPLPGFCADKWTCRPLGARNSRVHGTDTVCCSVPPLSLVIVMLAPGADPVTADVMRSVPVPVPLGRTSRTPGAQPNQCG